MLYFIHCALQSLMCGFNGVSIDQLSISSYDSISEASQLTSFPWFTVQQVFNMLKRGCIPIESLIPNIQLLHKKT